MRRSIVVGTALLALAAGAGCGGGKDPLVAKVGSREIRAGYLVDQYRAISAGYRPDVTKPDSLQAFLETVVKKDLLVDEARARGLEKDPEVVMRMEDTRKRTLLPELLKGVLAKQPTPTDADLAPLEAALALHYHVHVLMSTDRDRLAAAHTALKGGKPWSAVEKGWTGDPPGAQSGDKGWVALDGFPPELRNQIMALAPGGYSPIFEYQGVQSILYLEKKEPDPKADPTKLADRAKAIWQRDWQQGAVKAYEDDAKDRRHWATQDLVLAATTALFAAADSAKSGPPQLNDQQRSAELVSWDGGHLTVGDFLGRVQSVPPQYRPSLLDLPRNRAMVTSIAEDIFLLSEADSAGVSRRPELKNSLDRAEEQILLEKVQQAIAGDAKPTDEDLQQFYEQNKERFQVPAEQHVSAIVTPDSTSAVDIYVQVARGADFHQLARARSKHPSASSGGDLGWVGPDHLAELVPITLNMSPSRPIPPRKALGGWAVLRVEENRGTRQATLEDVRPFLETQVQASAEDRVLTAWVEKAMKEKVKMYPDRLKKVVFPPDLLPKAAPAAGAADTTHAAGAPK